MLLQTAFGKVIKDLRLQKGLTQQQFAEMADISVDYVHDLEFGLKKPSLNIVFSLASALGIAASNLILQVEIKMGGDDNSIPNSIS